MPTNMYKLVLLSWLMCVITTLINYTSVKLPKDSFVKTPTDRDLNNMYMLCSSQHSTFKHLTLNSNSNFNRTGLKLFAIKLLVPQLSGHHSFQLKRRIRQRYIETRSLK